jgi:hypothetical protein
METNDIFESRLWNYRQWYDTWSKQASPFREESLRVSSIEISKPKLKLIASCKKIK